MSIAFTLRAHSAPDALGRQTFELEWDGTDPVSGKAIRRGQFFFARIADHKAGIEARGGTVTALEQGQ